MLIMRLVANLPIGKHSNNNNNNNNNNNKNNNNNNSKPISQKLPFFSN